MSVFCCNLCHPDPSYHDRPPWPTSQYWSALLSPLSQHSPRHLCFLYPSCHEHNERLSQPIWNRHPHITDCALPVLLTPRWVWCPRSTSSRCRPSWRWSRGTREESPPRHWQSSAPGWWGHRNTCLTWRTETKCWLDKWWWRRMHLKFILIFSVKVSHLIICLILFSPFPITVRN